MLASDLLSTPWLKHSRKIEGCDFSHLFLYEGSISSLYGLLLNLRIHPGCPLLAAIIHTVRTFAQLYTVKKWIMGFVIFI